MDEIIHIARSEYNKMVETAKEIQSYTDDQNENRTIIKFLDRHNFPRIADMERYRVKHDMRKFLPYLVFYSDPSIYWNEDEEFEKSQKYIQNLIAAYVFIVEDEDFEPILSMTPGIWKRADINERADCFRALVEYYGQNEFETFMRDLGWKKFMAAYEYSQKDFNDGKRCDALREDLALLWDFLQDEPFEYNPPLRVIDGSEEKTEENIEENIDNDDQSE